MSFEPESILRSRRGTRRRQHAGACHDSSLRSLKAAWVDGCLLPEVRTPVKYATQPRPQASASAAAADATHAKRAPMRKMRVCVNVPFRLHTISQCVLLIIMVSLPIIHLERDHWLCSMFMATTKVDVDASIIPRPVSSDQVYLPCVRQDHHLIRCAWDALRLNKADR